MTYAVSAVQDEGDGQTGGGVTAPARAGRRLQQAAAGVPARDPAPAPDAGRARADHGARRR